MSNKLLLFIARDKQNNQRAPATQVREHFKDLVYGQHVFDITFKRLALKLCIYRKMSLSQDKT